MKVRTGFVSNSSSSSFLIYGACVDSEVIEELEVVKEKGEHEFERALRDGYGLSVDRVNCEGPYYIGVSWDYIGDNETGLQFKERVSNAIERVFGEKVVCTSWSESW
jgi:hypothetical protein